MTGRSWTTMAAAGAVLFAVSTPSCSGPSAPPTAGADTTATDSTAYFAFRNAVPNPAGVAGNFVLSKDYPSTPPAGGANMPWLQLPVDFTDATPDWNTGPWVAYMQSILTYVKEGQDAQLADQVGFLTQVNGSTRWFHIPWMAFNESTGRELNHGCTNERSTTVVDLDGDGVGDRSGSAPFPNAVGAATEKQYETWAVGLYNDHGAYNIGQVFPSSGPNAGAAQLDQRGLPASLPFNVGTCVVKLLFSTADSTVAPYLAGSPKWMVYGHTFNSTDTTHGHAKCERALQPVHLVQMDVAVAEPRAATGWVYGTFVYNADYTSAPADGSIWSHMQALGIQFGNDPQSPPAVASTTPIFQSVINPNVNIPEHLGCHGRLCGPIDNKAASCMSCHGGAYTAPMAELDKMGTNIPSIFLFTGMCDSVGSADNAAYFSNRKFPQGYYADMFPAAIPLDYSLQLQVAFGMYKTYVIEHGKPCKDN